MARLTGPLFSLDARGQLGESLVFAGWKGIPYARMYVIPENPNTADQQEIRGVFSTLNEMWKRMPQLARDPWQAAVRGRPLTDRNRHIQANAAALQGQADLDNLVMSVSGGQAVPPINVVETDAGAQVINVVADAPTLPPGYTLTSIIAVAVLDGDPSPVLVRETFANEDTSTPYSIDIDVGVAGTYQVGTFCEFERTADAQAFYSTAVRDQVVVA